MSSGNPRADRRLEVGLALKAEGDLDAAAGAIEQALELAPGWTAARFALAEVHEAAGRRGVAVAAYAACLSQDPDDVMGAAIRLALLGAAPVPDALPEAHLRTLFDQYAPRFERALLGGLSYRAPRQLRDAVDSLVPADAAWGRALDIGCGTGLAGEVFRARAAWLEGVDLSPGMVAAAARKKLYDRLETAEAVAFLRGLPESAYDFCVAADMVIYLGDIGPMFAAVARVLRPGAMFALTAQRGEGDGFVLGGDQRFWHSAPYLRRSAATAGLDVVLLQEAVSRTEKGRDVPGLIAVLRRPVADGAGIAVEPLPGHGTVPREPGSMPA